MLGNAVKQGTFRGNWLNGSHVSLQGLKEFVSTLEHVHLCRFG